MNTRAIIGYKRTDGTVVGAWCWSDRDSIKSNLERDFKALIDVNFLIEYGMINTIFSEDEYNEYFKEFRNNSLDPFEKYFTDYGKSTIVQNKLFIGTEPVEYRNLEEALSQDVGAAYIYENGKWENYKPTPKESKMILLLGKEDAVKDYARNVLKMDSEEDVLYYPGSPIHYSHLSLCIDEIAHAIKKDSPTVITTQNIEMLNTLLHSNLDFKVITAIHINEELKSRIIETREEALYLYERGLDLRG